MSARFPPRFRSLCCFSFGVGFVPLLGSVSLSSSYGLFLFVAFSGGARVVVFVFNFLGRLLLLRFVDVFALLSSSDPFS